MGSEMCIRDRATTHLYALLSTAKTTLRPGPFAGVTPLREAMLKGLTAALKADQLSIFFSRPTPLLFGC